MRYWTSVLFMILVPVSGLAEGQEVPIPLTPEAPPTYLQESLPKMPLCLCEPVPDLIIEKAPVEVIEIVPKIWSGETELGLTGTEGNSRNFKIRLGLKLKRETKRAVLTLDSIYRLANLESERSENRLFVTDKAEFPFANRPWNFFLSGTTEYDQFKAFDVRLARHLGFGYDWIKNGTTTLSTRLGMGTSKEFGGPENELIPEAIIGGDFEWKFNDRLSFTTSSDVFPDVSDAGEYRAQTKLSWEVIIDPTLGLTLRMGVLNLYDSTPEKDRKRNDIDYFATILWKF